MSSQPQNIQIDMHNGFNYKGNIYLRSKADPGAGEGQSEYIELMDSLRANRSHRNRLSQGIKTLMSGFFIFGEGAIPEFMVNSDDMGVVFDGSLNIPYDWDVWPFHWERRHANAYQVSVDIRADAIFLNCYDADGNGCCDEEKLPLGQWSSFDWEIITKGVVEIAKVLGFALVGTTTAKPVWRNSPEEIPEDWPRICLPILKEEKRGSVTSYEWATILAGDILHDSIKDGRLERALQERTDDRDAARRAFVEVVDRINMSAEKNSGASGTPER